MVEESPKSWGYTELTNYETYKKLGIPSSGQHIIGTYTPNSIYVYQAYKNSIADAAIKNQNFLNIPEFSIKRRTWIKPNFLWMMYRSGWGTKKNQERILCIEITLEGFEHILCNSVFSSSEHMKVIPTQAEYKKLRASRDVMLQWDPDHSPKGGKKSRRAIQLGLKGETLRKYVEGEWIINIYDITPFVNVQRINIQDEQLLMVPLERVFSHISTLARDTVEVDQFVEIGQ